jgi:hypothetical protein
MRVALRKSKGNPNIGKTSKQSKIDPKYKKFTSCSGHAGSSYPTMVKMRLMSTA